MKLIKDNALDGNEALLDFSYELIELVAGQGMMLLLLGLLLLSEF